MALPRLVGCHIGYAVPQTVIDGAPTGDLYRHFAFFSRLTGAWLGEVAGYVPYPDVPTRLGDEARRRALARWQMAAIRGLGTCYEVLDELWDEAFGRVPSEQTVALDVTRFAWPIGDHVWHRWDDIERFLDWPEASGHRFLEVDTTTLDVVAQVHSHRQVRDAVPTQHVVDITGTAYEPYWGSIWGRFVRRCDRWNFEPRVVRRNWREDVLRSVPEATRLALRDAAIDLDLVQTSADVWVPRRAVEQEAVAV